MEKVHLVLASTSSRRKQMLSWITEDYFCIPADIDESVRSGELPNPYTRRLSDEKALTAASQITQEEAVIIASDTTVYSKHQIYGKPKTPQHAKEMLMTLSGHEHLVCTSLSVLHKQQDTGILLNTFCETLVSMRAMNEDEISAYVESGDPMGKAGAYAIQNQLFHPVAEIKGCYACVVGFPLCHLQRCMDEISKPFGQNPDVCCRQHIHFQCSLDTASFIDSIHLRKTAIQLCAK